MGREGVGGGLVCEWFIAGRPIDEQLAIATDQNVANLAALTGRDLNNADDRTRDQQVGFYSMVGHIDQMGQRT